MHRTITTDQNIFQLPGPASVTYGFTRPHHIHISIPKDSTWRSELHWHNDQSSCERLECIHGHLRVFYYPNPYINGSISMSPGCHHTFEEGTRTSWASESGKEDLVVLLKANEVLYRNKLSATLDADSFPSLATTPAWLRILFRLFLRWPSAHHWLLVQMLWLQLQAINYTNGYYTLHGQLPLVQLWRWTHPFAFTERPPEKLMRLQWQSQILFSSITQAIYFWVGRALGMRGQYPEYTPR